MATTLLAASVPPVKADNPLPEPHILLIENGSETDITGKKVRIITGEQIALTTQPAPVAGQSQLWVISKGSSFPIADFERSETCQPGPANSASACCPISPAKSASACDGPTIPNFSRPKANFYITTPGVYGIAYGYRVGKNTASSTTVFDVVGPSSVSITYHLNAPKILRSSVQSGYRYFLSFGEKAKGKTGIEMYVSADEPVAGAFVWVQTINSIYGFTKLTGSSDECDELSGLDNEYPYDDIFDKDYANDSPKVEITGDELASFNLQAQMFVLWKSNRANSIVVPLGYVIWGGSLVAAYNAYAEPPEYPYTVSSSVVIPPSIIYEGVLYPTWYSVAKNDSPCHAKK
jgi:hypothetical protein